MSLGAQSSDTPSIQAPVLDIIRPQQESFGNSNKSNQKNRTIGIVKHFPKLQFLREKQLTPVFRELQYLAEINRKLQFLTFCMLRRFQEEEFMI